MLMHADAHTTIQLADMTGDGLVDLVRIRNGEVCYWQNLGQRSLWADDPHART
ncbi:MAG: hypothetical protein HC888_17665, partial [Candidatus Competibacteraceae bacterium]|nr:hypothetical protein [Candidatus Competibacteraceae bacterium]